MTILEERFEVLKTIGQGTFGSVVLARQRAPIEGKNSNELVAIKTVKKPVGQKGKDLREIRALKDIAWHQHIVQVWEILPDTDARQVHLVLEHMDCNLLQLLESRNGLPFEVASVRSMLTQILEAIIHIHRCGYFHRDIKPENVLVVQHKTFSFRKAPTNFTVKLADFGLARQIGSQGPYTSYVSTRWYRSPEVLLRAEQYDSSMDIWAFAVMAFEIATLRPLFPGRNEVDQLYRICRIIGSPGIINDGKTLSGEDWPQGYQIAERAGFRFPSWNPKARPPADRLLNHEFLAKAEHRTRLGRLASSASGKKLAKIDSNLEHSTRWIRRPFSQAVDRLTLKRACKQNPEAKNGPNDTEELSTISNNSGSLDRRKSTSTSRRSSNRDFKWVSRRLSWQFSIGKGQNTPANPPNPPPLKNARKTSKNTRQSGDWQPFLDNDHDRHPAYKNCHLDNCRTNEFDQNTTNGQDILRRGAECESNDVLEMYRHNFLSLESIVGSTSDSFWDVEASFGSGCASDAGLLQKTDETCTSGYAVQTLSDFENSSHSPG